MFFLMFFFGTTPLRRCQTCRAFRISSETYSFHPRLPPKSVYPCPERSVLLHILPPCKIACFYINYIFQ